jgi:hypothetical protein
MNRSLARTQTLLTFGPVALWSTSPYSNIKYLSACACSAVCLHQEEENPPGDAIELADSGIATRGSSQLSIHHSPPTIHHLQRYLKSALSAAHPPSAEIWHHESSSPSSLEAIWARPGTAATSRDPRTKSGTCAITKCGIPDQVHHHLFTSLAVRQSHRAVKCQPPRG